MKTMLNFPLVVFVVSFIALWSAALAGDSVRKRVRPLSDDLRNDFVVVQAATLTLLDLLIGFTFSMAVSRYDQRKNYEEAEANAISTEYVRADLLPAADAAKVQELLRSYRDERVLFYTTRNLQQRRHIDATTAHLQNDLWSAVETRVAAQPTALMALAVSGMNDVLNSQGYTQHAWWYRIPAEAWSLMAVIAIFCNLIIGYGARRTCGLLLLVLPLAVSISFLLIADIDSPLGGVIRVHPQNLSILAQTLHTH
jgi:hypothetical protein